MTEYVPIILCVALVLQSFGLIWIILKMVNVLALDRQVRVQAPVAPTPSAEPAPTPGKGVPASPPSPVPASPIDQGLVDFIKKAEGFQAKPYWDYKQWTHGYGTKASGPNDVITEADAAKELIAEINAAYKAVNDKYPNLPKGIAQALTDLTFNAGPGWENATLGQRVAEQKWDSVKADILLYNHAGGQVSPGLTARREAEVSWFDNPL